jgi:hypothetical protein
MMTSVIERCRAVATFRSVSVRLMETLARWTPTTPEMEAKVMFGRHIWIFAQHADRLGKRTFELRQAEHYTLPPAAPYAALLDEVGGHELTEARVSALYDGVLPGLAARYRAYIANTDPILDAPSIAIVEHILPELEGLGRDAAALQRELKLGSSAAPFFAREQSIPDIVAQGA